jgi:hypothetical protein
MPGIIESSRKRMGNQAENSPPRLNRLVETETHETRKPTKHDTNTITTKAEIPAMSP